MESIDDNAGLSDLEQTKSICLAINELSDQEFKVLAEAAIVYLYDNNKLERLNNLNKSLIDVNNCKNIVKWLIKTLITYVRSSNDTSKLVADYSNYGLNGAKTAILKDLWEKHSKSLSDLLESQSLMINQLVDMEWKFGVCASTNEIDKFGNAFLQLKLVVNNGSRLETHFMELTLPQFYSFLHEMNKAKSQMDYLS